MAKNRLVSQSDALVKGHAFVKIGLFHKDPSPASC